MNNKILKIEKWAVLVLIVAFLLGCKGKNEKDSEDSVNKDFKVEVIEVGVTTLNREYTYSGFVEPKVTVPLSFLLPGTVISVYVEEGDKVSRGQVLAELNKVTANNTYQGTLAALNQATDAYNRLKSVYDKGSLPEIKMQEITSQLEQAKSTNKVAYQNLTNCTLRAPKSGFIGARNIEVGSSTIPGNPVIDLVRIDEVYVRISVPENEINKISKGQKAKIIISALGSQEFIGKVEKVGVVANRMSKTYEVKILVPNPELLMKSGMACDVDVKLDSATKSRLAIPYRSVIKDENDKNYVFKVDVDSKTVTKQLVELGPFANNQIEIVSGLSQGDIIVTEGHHQLTNNDKVRF
ncbi:efflux RND transporter periplasmic adaptor subunit [Lutibacter sp. B1]|uniref:efflux RND transporter periplasmic adaptor subunit n=1 Tax=Lutibacter sp. B1 TaxID=2725996 RepID=UPI00145639D4|nr:efflux RND transporter periplasmic adaptor subunit [Lutibacter sp. B1]NLP58811.1 efflux RND transporter periplasmic adaptor subunit [Lutibacter sp. B1]